MRYHFSGPQAKTPQRGELVAGHIYIPSCTPGAKPIADYAFVGEFIGECEWGFMVKPTHRSDNDPNTETIFCRELHTA